MLANELSDLHADEIDLGLMGFDADELAKLLDLPAEPKDEAIPESAYSNQYGVIVVCESEQEQQQVYERLMSEGLKCKVVTT